MRRGTATLVSAVLAGCATTQTIEPLERSVPDEICIIENPDEKPVFLAEYRKTLEEFGYTVRILPESGQIIDCRITSTYGARWSWDFFWTDDVYLKHAEIKVSTGGAANPKGIIRAEPKIRELVIELFPRRSDSGV
jgi:hypothetical protein